jgi:hypothetical protein
MLIDAINTLTQEKMGFIERERNQILKTQLRIQRLALQLRGGALFFGYPSAKRLGIANE